MCQCFAVEFCHTIINCGIEINFRSFHYTVSVDPPYFFIFCFDRLTVHHICDRNWMNWACQFLNHTLTSCRFACNHNFFRCVDQNQINMCFVFNFLLYNLWRKLERITPPKWFLSKFIRSQIPCFTHSIHRPSQAFREKL